MNYITIVLVIAAVLLPGCSTSRSHDSLRAQRFELVDADGNIRAEIALDEHDSAGLFIRDDKGRLRASLSHDDSQSALYLYDEDGTIRVGAAFYAHGGGGVALHGPESEGAAVLYYKDGGSLTFYSPEGDVLHRTPAPDR